MKECDPSETEIPCLMTYGITVFRPRGWLARKSGGLLETSGDFGGLRRSGSDRRGRCSPVEGRPGDGAAAVNAKENDQRRLLATFAAQICDIMSRMSPIFDLLRETGKTDSGIAALLDQLLAERLGGMGFLVQQLSRIGRLRAGVSSDEAAETVWVVSSGEVFRLLTTTRKWPRERYVRWLADTLEPPPAAARTPSVLKRIAIHGSGHEKLLPTAVVMVLQSGLSTASASAAKAPNRHSCEPGVGRSCCFSDGLSPRRNVE